MADHYKAPDWFTRHVFNPAVAGLTRLGVGVYGSRVLEVRGRKSGEWRRTPVNLLTVGDEQYLVAPRGHTQWVRNMRAAGGDGRLILGRRVRPITTTELSDPEKPPILRAYLRKWAWETKQFFGGASAESSEAELLRIAPDHPVFRLERS
ncbi:MAG TPA: nitroreductase family deazaflavin-dependent oxidoreductase [Solirubrobacteraceae bacterium]|nr:nitroreductase family deazaflavin-dependent oxidoreductase [Solirubrobacteraceae bacterium]